MATVFRENIAPTRRSFVDRVPAAEQSEIVVIGAALMDGEALAQVLEQLPPDAFSDRGLRQVRHTMQTLVERGDGVNLTTVYETMNAQGHIGPDGIYQTYADFSALLTDPPFTHVETNIRVVRRAYVKRVKLRHFTRIGQAAGRSGSDEMLRELEIARAELERVWPC